MKFDETKTNYLVTENFSGTEVHLPNEYNMPLRFVLFWHFAPVCVQIATIVIRVRDILFFVLFPISYTDPAQTGRPIFMRNSSNDAVWWEWVAFLWKNKIIWH